MSAEANPNQNNKSVTYTWNDRSVAAGRTCPGCIDNDRRYQRGEEVGAPTATSLAGTVNLDPELSQPYSHDVTAYSSGRSRQSLGARVGFVFKSEDDLIQSFQTLRPASAYTLPYSFVDVGVDGRTGTSDDQTLTLLRGAVSAGVAVPGRPAWSRTSTHYSRFRTVEASMNKRFSNRWSLQAGGSRTWAKEFFEVNNPNATENSDTARWDFKLSGTYEGPYAIRFSPLVRHQAGANFARTISVGAGVATAAGGIFSGTIDAEPRDARRHDNITVLDLQGRSPVQSRQQASPPRAVRSVQHHEQQRGRDPDGLDWHQPSSGRPRSSRRERRGSERRVSW